MRLFFCVLILLSIISQASAQNRGILGKQAPEWKVSDWHQLPAGKKSLNPKDYKGKVLYLYFFQSWCPGCHSSGFPTLKKMSEHYANNPNVEFAVIQTTFEGHSINNVSKLAETAKRYQLKIPFGQSAGKRGTPEIMQKYRTGGTPWTVIIDTKGKVRYNHYHIKPTQAAELIDGLIKAK